MRNATYAKPPNFYDSKKNRLHAAKATHSLKQYEKFAMSNHRLNALHSFLGVLVAAESR